MGAVRQRQIGERLIGNRIPPNLLRNSRRFFAISVGSNNLAENVSWIAVLSLKKVLRELHNKFDGILLTVVVAQMVISGLLSPHSRPFGVCLEWYFFW